MKLSLVRLASFATLAVAALGGCSAPPTDLGESTGTSQSGLTLSQLPPIQLDLPLLYCTSSPATESVSYPTEPGPNWLTNLGSQAVSSSCGYSVFEMTGMVGHGFLFALTDTPPAYEPEQFAAPPGGVVDAAACAASYVTYEIMGYVPAHIEPQGLLVVTVPGAWVDITSGTIGGTWVTGANRCAFEPLESGTTVGYGPDDIGHVVGTTYSTIRVATRGELQTPSGEQWVDLFAYVP